MRVWAAFDIDPADVAEALAQQFPGAESRGPVLDLSDLIQRAIYDCESGPMLSGEVSFIGSGSAETEKGKPGDSVYVATVRLVLPVDVQSEAEACDAITGALSESLKYSSAILDWSYVPDAAGVYQSPAPFKTGAEHWQESGHWEDESSLESLEPIEKQKEGI